MNLSALDGIHSSTPRASAWPLCAGRSTPSDSWPCRRSSSTISCGIEDAGTVATRLCVRRGRHRHAADDPDKTIRKVIALRQHETPADALASKQEHAEVVRRLQTVLTKREFFVYTMLFVDEMPVKDIATALGVSTRTINTYKNAALDKVAEMRKEFKK